MEKQAIRDTAVSEVMKSVRNYGLYGALFFGGAAGAKAANNKADKRSGAYQKSVIKQYKKEHPNTQLSDADILKNELGYNYNQQRG